MAKIPKPQKIKTSSPLVPVVGDAGIATAGVMSGKIVPFIIVDDSRCPNLSEVIRVHEHTPEGGDVSTQWATQNDVLGRAKVVLLVDFIRPVKLSCVIGFNMPSHAVLIDQMISVGKVNLMTGKSGDRYITSAGRPKISMEIPETGFGPVWKDLYRREMVRKYKKQGNSSKEAQHLADRILADRDQLANFSFDEVASRTRAEK